MTEQEMNSIIEGMKKDTAEVMKSKDLIWKSLIRAGIETEESRREHEEKMAKKAKKEKK